MILYTAQQTTAYHSDTKITFLLHLEPTNRNNRRITKAYQRYGKKKGKKENKETMSESEPH